MQCYFHPDIEAAVLCSHCGRFICETCKVEWQDTLYCARCADLVVPKAEPEGVPEKIVAVAPETVNLSKVSVEIPKHETKIAIPPQPEPDIVPKPRRIRLKQPVLKKTPAKVREHKPLFPPDYSPKTLGSMFSLEQDYLSPSNMAYLLIGFFILVALFLLPWAVAGGFGFNLLAVSGVIAAFSIIFLILYLGATFVSYEGLRSMVRGACSLVLIILWLIFFLTTFQEISQLSVSPVDMLGPGSMVFVASSILGVILGILELRSNSRDFLLRVLATFSFGSSKKA